MLTGGNSPLSDKDPFDGGSAAVSAADATKPEGDSVIGYSYYLPRIDKLVLDPSGIFTVVKGVSSSNPKPANSF